MHLKKYLYRQRVGGAATAKEILVVQAEGKRQVRHRLKHYNLDAIISVGYKVNIHPRHPLSPRGHGVLREHLTQGYSLDRERFERNAAELEAALLLVKRPPRARHLPPNWDAGWWM